MAFVFTTRVFSLKTQALAIRTYGRKVFYSMIKRSIDLNHLKAAERVPYVSCVSRNEIV